ncbi:hypothetical protein CDD83_5280 [Cordyceps sp. RAO-2017]|nr:hypothetical protein CDD83_5280 [Cordyceps sp. RAO-2017]
MRINLHVGTLGHLQLRIRRKTKPHFLSPPFFSCPAAQATLQTRYYQQLRGSRKHDRYGSADGRPKNDSRTGVREVLGRMRCFAWGSEYSTHGDTSRGAAVAEEGHGLVECHVTMSTNPASFKFQPPTSSSPISRPSSPTRRHRLSSQAPAETGWSSSSPPSRPPVSSPSTVHPSDSPSALRPRQRPRGRPADFIVTRSRSSVAAPHVGPRLFSLHLAAV